MVGAAGRWPAGEDQRPGPEHRFARLAIGIAVVTVAGAVVIRALAIDPGRIGSVFGALILLATLAAILSGLALAIGWPRTLTAFGLVVLLGAAAEVVGIYRAELFGRYVYTDWWFPTVGLPKDRTFPLLLPATWFLFVAAWYLTLARRLSGVRLVVATALLAALADLTLEAMLTRVALLWTWLEPVSILGAPWRNFAGWLVVAAGAAAILEAVGAGQARRMVSPPRLLVAGLVGSAVIGMTHGEPVSATALLLLPIVSWATRAPALG